MFNLSVRIQIIWRHRIGWCLAVASRLVDLQLGYRRQAGPGSSGWVVK